MKKWKATPSEVAQDGKYLGVLEFQDKAGEWHHFEVIRLEDRLLFGGACNAGFVESGYIRREDGEDMDETLSALLQDMEAYYNDGQLHVSRIVCNERM
jgi:hypothetical protein